MRGAPFGAPPQLACNPDSVGCSHPSHRVLGTRWGFRPAAHLDLAGPGHRSCLALHRTGFAWPPRHRDAGALLPHHFTLACARLSYWRAIGGVISVALSRGFPRVGVTHRPCPVVSGLSSRVSPPATAQPASWILRGARLASRGSARDDRFHAGARRQGGLSARLPGHLRDADHGRRGRPRGRRRRRSRASDHRGLPLRQGLQLPRPRLLPRPHPRAAGPQRRQGRRASSAPRAGTRRSTSRRRGCAGRSTSTAASRCSPTATWAPRGRSRAARSRTG